ncbi:hypothetical protein CYMTET_12461 [Cymbomonas tetramitiformis]|uniref:Uncharacterized protein n=1 Tax=Cymbomonas tetramitiformis TaxID=36881 RepID=A0AAE0LC54_9CHLO|nr:hypothetical protein CYMTET_12461 [Cymbomonas tetramitiformis]
MVLHGWEAEVAECGVGWLLLVVWSWLSGCGWGRADLEVQWLSGCGCGRVVLVVDGVGVWHPGCGGCGADVVVDAEVLGCASR